MRRFSLAFLMISFCVFISSLLVLGCGGKKPDDDDDDTPRRPKKTTTGPSAAAPTQQKVEAKQGYGTISGRVTIEGDASSIISDLDANLKTAISANTDSSYCLTGKKGGESSPFPIQPYETNQQDYRIGKNKGLGNVFVWIEPQPGFYFDIPQDQLDAIPKEVTITQPHCNFFPHCTVLFPSYNKDGAQVKTGQNLIIENDALVLHNAKIQGLLNNPPNEGLSPRKPDGKIERKPVLLRPEKSPVTMACDVHKWMKSYIRVHDHPYAAVTSVGADLKDQKKKVYENLDSAEVGNYTIKGVPVGASVKLFVWHERAGFLTAPSGDTITLAKENKKDFTATPK